MSLEDKKEVILFTPIVENYYLRINAEVPELQNLFKPTVWNWEVKIAIDSNDIYYGSAVEVKRGVTIPWIKLKKHEYIEEMKQLCLKYSKSGRIN
ncbi:hypothetical protein [Bacillus bingmayongensis]|uniref:hypothetical protein n=1 Tax=Bacillus bingmayongensis TaxID=1150157 RepID=UPI001C8F0FFA|nr:hypothetical protein [Bacillus bingmayongensis]MBY0597706.1 hypothetical protein [Bacillus bingmayongensis]